MGYVSGAGQERVTKQCGRVFTTKRPTHRYVLHLPLTRTETSSRLLSQQTLCRLFRPYRRADGFTEEEGGSLLFLSLR